MFFWLITMELILVFVYAVIHIIGPGIPWGPARALFNLDAEASIPAWFSSIQLFVTGSMLFVASRNNQRKQHVSSSFLTGASLFFIFLSADESAAIHEKLTDIAKNLELFWLLFKGGHGAWITLYITVAVAAVLLTARHFRFLWRYFRREIQVAIGGTIAFVMGGAGFEVISYQFLRSGFTPNLYKVEVACEEFLEMSGVSIILYAVLLLSIAISTKSPIPLSEEITPTLQKPERSIASAARVKP